MSGAKKPPLAGGSLSLSVAGPASLRSPTQFEEKSEIDIRCPALSPPTRQIGLRLLPSHLDLQPLVAFLVDYVEENGDGAAELCKKSEMEPCHPRPVLASQSCTKVFNSLTD